MTRQLRPRRALALTVALALAFMLGGTAGAQSYQYRAGARYYPSYPYGGASYSRGYSQYQYQPYSRRAYRGYATGRARTKTWPTGRGVPLAKPWVPSRRPRY